MSIKVLLVTPYSFQKYGGVQNQVNLIEDYLSSHEEFDVKVFAYGKTESLDSNKVFNIPTFPLNRCTRTYDNFF